jgi:hypothetical protein
MSAAAKAIDRLANELAGEALGDNPTREELLAMAFLELREEIIVLRRQQQDAPPRRVSRDGGYVMLKEAAYRAGRSVEYMRKLAARGAVDAVFQDARWWVRVDDQLAKGSGPV